MESDLPNLPQRLLIPRFKSENEAARVPLLILYLSLGLRCTKVYCFVHYTPKHCFNCSVRSVVDARRTGNDNSETSVVAKTIKLLGSRPTETKHLNGEKPHKGINGKMIERLKNVSKNYTN